jgi:dienelactone hydrolase
VALAAGLAFGLWLALVPLALHGAEAVPLAAGPWNLEALRQPPEVTWLKRDGRLRELLYAGETYQGKPTRVFAYYALPATNGKRAPAMVLVHGGGGKAFAEWANLWAQRGYVAIAMDLAGRGPDRERLPDGGPDQREEDKFQSIAGGLLDTWPHHAVANVIRAVSLLAAQPDVDPDRIGITGISWGGYLTSLVSGLDQRLRVAIPVYGCGFIYRNSPWEQVLNGLPSEQRDSWTENFDPSKYLPLARVPMLWVNGANDFHYRMDNYRDSFRLPHGQGTLSIVVNRKHSRLDGWAPVEIELFADQHLRGGAPLPELGGLVVRDGLVEARVRAQVGLTRGELIYTYEDPASEKSLWRSAPAEITAGRVRAALPDPAPRAIFLNVTDERGATVSTQYW